MAPNLDHTIGSNSWPTTPEMLTEIILETTRKVFLSMRQKNRTVGK